jgi:tetratricopeptide (TPR) repeat protein
MPNVVFSQHPPGSEISGRFVIEAALGRGGMAAVYRVRDLKTGERLALKRSWAKDSAKAARRSALLEREFHTLAQLRHPRIIEVYDYAVDEFGPYYTMELLDGTDLDQGGKLPWQEACALLRDIASSLAIVHSRGLLHRDVSGRNVRRTADGRAKLIDFGALVSMGVANDVVGTAPFMAPEALQMQALDARADLFSLGALGYYLLTGRHAYPARRSSDLRDVWRSRPLSPSRAFPEIPAALSALVLQLLSLDRGGRPQTAAEVMERLCVIASLPKEELPEILRGYLTTPTLVGRHATLMSIRSRMLSLVRGDGGALLLEGSAGSGRSRMIDACVFEGKLLSAVVVRADAGDAAGPWGVAQAISSQLFALLPQESIEAARLSAGVLAHVIDELSGEQSATETATFPERSLILRELRDFVLALARQQRLLIVVDDADRIDEPSAAWLAALADKADRQKLMLVAAMEPEAQQSAPTSLHLFRSLAFRVPLPALDAEQTEALMRSMFGDVPNLGLFAGRIHALAHGNPRGTMELAQHLVDRGLARYEGGSWLLPQLLDAADLPATLADSLARRLDFLGPDARDLAEALSVADAIALPLADYRTLTRHGDQNRLFLALEELVSARILIAGTERYRFSQRGLVAVLLATMSSARKAELHGRLAELLAQTAGDVLLRAQHLMAAGRQREAVDLLCSMDLQARLPPLPLLEEAVVYSEAAGVLPARAIHRLRMALMTKASVLVERTTFRRYLPLVIKQLEHDSGLALYRELRDVPEPERLSQALTRQQQIYLATPEREQVYGVGDAVRELARVIGAACGIAGASFDLELLEELPSLEPFAPLSPSLRVIEQVKIATQLWLSGRTQRASKSYEEILARIREPDRAGLDEVQFERTHMAIQYILALAEASGGVERAEERAALLESRRAHRVNAWRVRSLLQLNLGDTTAAQKSTRRAELLQLQDDTESHYLGTSAAYQLLAAISTADVLAVKSAADLVTIMAQSYPGWRAMSRVGQSWYRYLLGDLEGALDMVLAGFEITGPGRQVAWGMLAAQHVKLLRELGRPEESLACAETYVEVSHAQELTGTQRYILAETARTYAALGRHAEALAMIDPLLQLIESSGSRGLALGTFYETRARIAISMADRAAFEQYAELCAHEYKRGNNPALSAKFARLMEQAQKSSLVPGPASVPNELRPPIEAEQEEADNTIVSRMLECLDTSDRARCGLTMLLQSTDAYLGYLYGANEGGLVALAGIPDVRAEPPLEQWLGRWLQAEREIAARAASATTATVSGEPPDSAPTSGTATADSCTVDDVSSFSAEYADAEGRRFSAIMLVRDEGGERQVAGVLALHCEGRRVRPPIGLLAQIAAQLLAHNDVQGVTLGQAPVAPPL